jgi:cytochrome c
MQKRPLIYRLSVLIPVVFNLAGWEISAAGDLDATVDAASIEDGAIVFEVCAACHSAGPDEPPLIGPNLWQVAGRDIASSEGFAYSPGLKAVDGTWTRANLDAFLSNPGKFAKGTIMGFGGLSNAAERASVIAYLETLVPGGTPVVGAGAAADYGEDWPAGTGAELTGRTCSVCHSLAIVKQQGLSRERWDKLLRWMVEEQGMTEPAAPQRAEILDYLSTHFGTP